MRREELMPGDWVRHKCNLAPVKIQGLTKKYFTYDDGYCGGVYDEIEPIPITAEILEKNGFKREEEGRGFSEPYCVYVNDDFQYVVKVYPKDIMDRYSRLEIGEYDDNEYMSLLINHVHELQHALRLADINKEITI